MGAPFRIYNTLSKKLEDFKPIKAGEVRLYVCGMTVYDHAHVGHARAMVVFDAFARYLKYRNWTVRFIRNFTDVDDKIIRRAAERGEEPMDLAEYYIRSFREDASGLGLIKPDLEPRVSESIQDIIDMIERIVSNGNAYPRDGSVWFDVDTFSEYGKLSGQKVSELRSADEESGKNNPADFALWKAAKPGEPKWPSPWGEGRPGWHIECSAMAFASLGEEIDIHGGGLDLVFPHHENEVAQSECANHTPFAHYWMHNGLLTMKGGQKMGKSLGNVINIRDALKAYPAESVRLYLLQSLYRSPLPWSETALNEALSMLARLYEAKELAMNMGGKEKPEAVAQSLGEDAQKVYKMGLTFIDQMHTALDEDFNTSLALSYAFELARAINRFSAHKKSKKRGGPVVAPALAGFSKLGESIGLLGDDPAAFQVEVKEKRLEAMGLSREEIESALAERKQARIDKDWGKSDIIRDELSAKGISVMDTPEGVDWRVQL